MSEQPKKKRAWFQFSLGTAVIMMFVAAGLMWANIHCYEGRDPTGYWTYVEERGWPLVYLQSTMGLHGITVCGGNFSLGYLVLDGIVALAIVFAVAVGNERFIRHRERRP